MKLKSHFEFSKQQRFGIFLLLLIIIVLQCIYHFIGFSSEPPEANTEQLVKFQKQIDSLKLVAVEDNKPKLFPFNPNYITDYKGYTLGMTNEEIDRLLAYRKQNKWVNSAQQFQKVTGVSDSLLKTIAPYFKFPEWVTNSNKSNQYVPSYSSPKDYDQKIDLNKATAIQLRRVNGVGEKLADRIISFRDKHPGGFIADVQLFDVYGLSQEVIERIKNQFTVKTPRQVIKLNLNKASQEDLVIIPHIDYEIAYAIVEYRTLIEAYKDLNDLVKVKNFPMNKIEIIKLYLTLD